MSTFIVNVTRSKEGTPGLLNTITVKDCRKALGCLGCEFHMCRVKMQSFITGGGHQIRQAQIDTRCINPPCSTKKNIEVIKKSFF